MIYYAAHLLPSSGQMSSQIPVMSTHHYCGDEMCSSVNLTPQVMEAPTQVENFFEANQRCCMIGLNLKINWQCSG